MSENDKKTIPEICRRDALKLGTLGAGAAAAGLKPENLLATLKAAEEKPRAQPELPPSGTGPGEVVKVHMPGMRVGIHPHKEAASFMVEKAVKELAQKSSVRKAWLSFVKPSDRIGIKINCLGTRMVSSQKEVVMAVVKSLVASGIPESNIVIFDMFASNMMGGRYNQQPIPGKLRVLAHRKSSYYNKTFKAGPARARISNIFMDCDAVINVPPIKDHDLMGVTCCMKNITFGIVEKPHINHSVGNEAIAHLWALEEIRSRVKLNIIDGSTILYDGGPKYNRRALVPHESVYATTDPVAMDRIAHELIEVLRAENGLKTLAEVRRPAMFIKLSEQLGLGIAERKRIHLKTVDLPRFTGKSA